MIPGDTTMVVLVSLLAVIGVLGLLRPRWFHAVARFPFVFMPQRPYDEQAGRRARAWGAISLVSAIVIALITDW